MCRIFVLCIISTGASVKNKTAAFSIVDKYTPHYRFGKNFIKPSGAFFITEGGPAPPSEAPNVLYLNQFHPAIIGFTFGRIVTIDGFGFAPAPGFETLAAHTEIIHQVSPHRFGPVL